MAEYKNPYGDSLLDAVLSSIRNTLGTARSDMAKVKSGEAPTDLVNLLMDLVGEAPVGKALSRGGAVAKSVIAPTANKKLQGLFEALRGKAPKLVQKAEGMKETLRPYLLPRETMVTPNALGEFRRSDTMPVGDLHIRGGRPAAEQADTLGHELRHFLNAFDPAIMNKKPEHALETAQQLSGMMPVAQKSAMSNYLPSSDATPMILSNLRQQPPGSKGPASLAFDESIAYLTEALMQGNKGGDPALESIANALGFGVK